MSGMVVDKIPVVCTMYLTISWYKNVGATVAGGKKSGSTSQVGAVSVNEMEIFKRTVLEH